MTLNTVAYSVTFIQGTLCRNEEAVRAAAPAAATRPSLQNDAVHLPSSPNPVP